MEWSLSKKVAFRFLFAYFGLYSFPFLLDWMVWLSIVPRAGRLLGVNAVRQWTGSGDTTYHYVQILCILILAAVTTLIWSFADRKRQHYHRLHQWLIVLLRISLGMSMIGYGAAKVIQSQFPPLEAWRLFQPIGDASPMGLLWTFMGASAAYNVFAGTAEMLGGILVFFRRTATLGALILIGVLSNIVLLNFSYDVPVKLGSSHLFMMAVLIAAFDAKRLVNFFLLNRAADPVPIEPLVQRPRLGQAGFASKILVLLFVTGNALHSSYSSTNIALQASPLQGTWEVDEFRQEGELRPPLITDHERWMRLIVPAEEFAFVQLMNNERVGGAFYARPKDKKLYFKDQPFSYSQPASGTLELEGYFQGHDIAVKLHRVPENQFLLINRGFHWISEYPFNR